jgi:spermidine synthase
MAEAKSAALKPLEGQWFHETSSLWPGQCFSIEAEEVLFTGKSEFQDILVFQSTKYGRVLVLDGAIQLTERDEFSYQEMITHIPVFAHPNPKRICVIGGGDGAVLTQLIKHKNVEKIVLCEIDQLVIETSKKYFPNFLPGWNDPRVEVVVRDGFQYLRENPNTFDCILVDSSDPNEGPAQTLFSKEFFTLLRDALTDEGIICTQAESIWLHLQFISSLLSSAKDLFHTARYAYTTIPSYPSGVIGFCLATKSANVCLEKPQRTLEEALGSDAGTLRYYTLNVHTAAFVLPAFAEREFAGNGK